MFNKVYITSGTFILSLFILIAATSVETMESNLNQQVNENQLTGEVVDAETQEGIPDATVYLNKSEGMSDRTTTTSTQNRQGTADRDSTTTDYNGEFTFENAELTGTVTLEAKADGYESEEKEVDLEDHGDNRINQDQNTDQDRIDENKITIELTPENR